MKPEPVRWALIARPHNRLAVVLLTSVPREVERGARVIAREDEALCRPTVERTDDDCG